MEINGKQVTATDLLKTLFMENENEPKPEQVSEAAKQAAAKIEALLPAAPFTTLGRETVERYVQRAIDASQPASAAPGKQRFASAADEIVLTNTFRELERMTAASATDRAQCDNKPCAGGDGYAACVFRSGSCLGCGRPDPDSASSEKPTPPTDGERASQSDISRERDELRNSLQWLVSERFKVQETDNVKFAKALALAFPQSTNAAGGSSPAGSVADSNGVQQATPQVQQEIQLIPSADGRAETAEARTRELGFNRCETGDRCWVRSSDRKHFTEGTEEFLNAICDAIQASKPAPVSSHADFSDIVREDERDNSECLQAGHAGDGEPKEGA